MATNYLNPRWFVLALPLLGAITGCCCQAFPLPDECDCPTDARRIYCGAGEEAVRRCPCGPDHEFYGHKPTSWRAWPDGWKYGQYPCATGTCDTMRVEPVNAAPSVVEPVDLNPFRNMAPAEELPLETTPIEAEPTPKTEPTEKSATKANSAAIAPAKAEPSKVAPGTGIDAEVPAATHEATPQKTPAEAPTKPAPTPTIPPQASPMPMAPADSAPAETPHIETQENKSSSNPSAIPKLVAAANVPQSAKLTPQTPTTAAHEPATSLPATVPATAWSGRPKASAIKATNEESPISERVSAHLTHTLMN